MCALKYTKTCNKTQFDHIQQLEKELATIKSNVSVSSINSQTSFVCIIYLRRNSYVYGPK